MDTILLFDSWPVVTTGLSTLLQSAGIQNRIYAAHRLEEALQSMSGRLALLILDPGNSDTTPDKLVNLARRTQPDLPILFFSNHAHGLYLSMAYMLAVNGYLEKNSDADTIAATVRTVLAGMQCFPHQQAFPISCDATVQKLSPKELVILQLMRQGLRNKDIAQRLYLSPKTVSAHKHNLLHKLGLSDIVPAQIEVQADSFQTCSAARNPEQQLLFDIKDTTS
ncbi:LuxR C-terminal-related transcriptional regulator [Pusillimonas sp.]|uniref:LuxR C-terminal-related transcriptional regulator n=1 Tax=Pusillimonas sp. TaxID=3040095 RepID=UPI0037C87E40